MQSQQLKETSSVTALLLAHVLLSSSRSSCGLHQTLLFKVLENKDAAGRPIGLLGDWRALVASPESVGLLSAFMKCDPNVCLFFYQSFRIICC